MDPQLKYAIAYWSAVSKIAGLHLPYPAENAGLRRPVSQCLKPLVKGVLSRLKAVPDDFEHGLSVA